MTFKWSASSPTPLPHKLLSVTLIVLGREHHELISYYIDIDEIPVFLLLLKNHIFTARSERIIFIFHM